MSYNEIINELSLPGSKTSAGSILTNAGYELAGRGARGDVWMKPGIKGVLKLFNDVYVLTDPVSGIAS